MAAAGVVRSLVAWGGRRHRRAARRGRLAHVEVRGLDGPRAASVRAEVERALRAAPSVVRAWVNGPLGRVIVELADDEVDLGDVVDVVAEVETALDVAGDGFPLDRADHPADVAPIAREAVAAAASVVAIGAGAAGRLARLPRLPAEVGGLVSWVESQRHVRNAVESVAGPSLATAGLSILNAAVQAAAQGPVGPLADLGHRLSLVAEGRSRQAAWDRVQADMHAPGREATGGDHAAERAPGDPGSRPVPLHHGPVETYGDQASVASLAAAGGTFLATADLRRSAAAALATTPKAARFGREAFAAHLGRALADRDILCLDTGALRRLDRIDTVVLDASAVTTGELAIDGIEVVGDAATSQVRRRARDLFDPRRPARTVRRRGWSLGPLAPAERRLAAGVQGSGDVLALRRGDEAVAVVRLCEAVEPMAYTLAGTARDAGHMVVVAGTDELAGRLGAHLRVAGGAGPEGLLASVRMLQQDGCGVALLAASGGAALAVADLGVGLAGTGVPWEADVLVHDLTGAALVLDALAVAHDVSRQSAALALAGSAVGGALALTSAPARATARAMTSVNAAAIAALANGARAALALAAQPPATADDHPPWHELDPDEVLAHLASTANGLSADDAAERARRSATVEDGPVSLPVAVLEELANPLTPVLAGAAALSTAVGSVVDAGLVGAVAGVNALVGGAQRYQVERAVRRLEAASNQRVRVRRGGDAVTVPVAELVPGDVVALSAGDSVPADCRIIESTALEVDESSLTGESMPVAKRSDASLSPVLAERTSMIYEGTLVAAGEVVAAVVATGRDTEARRGVSAPGTTDGGVEARLRDLTRVTLPLAGVAGAGLVATGMLRGRSIAQGLHAGVSLAVAAVPEGLPILATMAQLSAARRLSDRGALVRNPRAIEALGRVDLLCCDKTGTLTEGRIELDGVFDGRTEVEVEPTGPGGAILAAALRASPLVSPGADPLPHLTDRAVVEGAARRGVDATTGVAGWHRRDELPFEPARGYHAVLGRNGRLFLLSVKGAPEVVLPRCTSWRHRGRLVELDAEVRDDLHDDVEALARRGHRVLAVAEREASSGADLDDARVDHLRLLGFVALSDPVRPTAAASVATLAAAGVRTVMITGDHPSTAEGIAADLGLLDGRRVVTGPQLDALDDPALDAVLDETTVFARVTPAHKVRLVEAYRRQGRAVAMTGDGANDAPAIRLANVGVALGEHSTSAARAVADVVVTDGRIETLIDAVVEGRAMWASVREALAILVGGNLGEILFTVGAGALTGNALSPRQLLLVNLFTDAVPSLAIAVRTPRDKGPEDLLREGPEASLGVALERQILSRALATAAGAGMAWAGGRLTGRARRASTIALVGLVGTQLGQTLVAGGRDPMVVAAAAGSAAALAGVIQTPGVSRFFGCTPLGPVGWGIGLGGAAAGVGLSLVLPPVVGEVTRWRVEET
ncbi:MAG TPA: HAD-IC family P-type ATPase [Acidimicrobiales bacterium]|nr:HAD-IC family P-type ATPase [Acidimicrobiales bacterium]